MHMKKATNITLATLAAALLASSCIKEADPYEIATEDQVTLETLIEGIPASLVQAGSVPGFGAEIGIVELEDVEIIRLQQGKAMQAKAKPGILPCRPSISPRNP